MKFTDQDGNEWEVAGSSGEHVFEHDIENPNLKTIRKLAPAKPDAMEESRELRDEMRRLEFTFAKSPPKRRRRKK